MRRSSSRFRSSVAELKNAPTMPSVITTRSNRQLPSGESAGGSVRSATGTHSSATIAINTARNAAYTTVVLMTARRRMRYLWYTLSECVSSTHFASISRVRRSSTSD